MMLIRTGGGHSARLSIPRDTVVDIPGHGMAKINAAYAYGGAGARDQDGRELPRDQGQPRAARSTSPTSRSSSTRWAASTYTGSCVVSFISGGFRNGGFTLRLQSGTHHLDGAQALALARTRENHCNPRETDLTRELRQQKLLLDMKSQMLSFVGLHPPAVDRLGAAADDRDRHERADARRRARLARAGRQRPHGDPLPDRRREAAPGRRAGLTITQPRKQADVAAVPAAPGSAIARPPRRARASATRTSAAAIAPSPPGSCASLGLAASVARRRLVSVELVELELGGAGLRRAFCSRWRFLVP